MSRHRMERGPSLDEVEKIGAAIRACLAKAGTVDLTVRSGVVEVEAEPGDVYASYKHDGRVTFILHINGGVSERDESRRAV